MFKPDWRSHPEKGCRDIDIELFFDETPQNIQWIRANLCADCPVWRQCEEWALQHYDLIPMGIFAGWSSPQRKRMGRKTVRFAHWRNEPYTRQGYVSRAKWRACPDEVKKIQPLASRVELQLSSSAQTNGRRENEGEANLHNGEYFLSLPQGEPEPASAN